MAKHKREVYPTDQIAHLWAHAPAIVSETSVMHARNPQGNFSFSGGDLHSYSTRIAVKLEYKRQTAFLIRGGQWSQTITGHLSKARRAAHGHHVYIVDLLPTMTDDTGAHKHNVDAMLASAAESFGKAKRARTHGAWYLESAQKFLASAASYAKLFGVRRKIPTPDGLDKLATQIAEREAKAKREETKKQTELRATNEAFQAAHDAAMPAMIQAWRDHQDTANGRLQFNYNGAWYSIVTPYDLTAFNGGHLMRISGDEVITNIGARVPISAVATFAPLVLRAMAQHPEPSALVGHHVGAFAISEITADYVRVGCHTFTRAEIENIQREIANRAPAGWNAIEAGSEQV